MVSDFERFTQSLSESIDLIEQNPQIKSGVPSVLQNLEEVLDTPSLLSRCDEICQRYEKKKPKLRIIHHLACSGGTLLSEYLSLLPNVYVLSEIHPSFHISSSSPTDIAQKATAASIPNSDIVNQAVFLEHIKRLNTEIEKCGGSLVIFDFSFIDFFKNKNNHNTLLDVLSKEFDIISLILHRNPIDTYASLINQNIASIDFDKYCELNLEFITNTHHDFLLHYEDLSGSPTEHLKQICDYFDLSFSEDFLLYHQDVLNNNLDTWRETKNDTYNCKLSTKPDNNVLKNSSHFLALQNITKTQRKKITLIATIPRSGSTWLYNCVRQIYTKFELDFYSCWVEDYDPSHPSKNHIIKVHDPEYLLSTQADIILSTRRDIRDICKSLIRMGWCVNDEQSIMKVANRLINTVHPFWNSRTSFELEYQDILSNSCYLISNIAQTLDITLSNNDINEIDKYLKNMKSPKKYDKETQLHPGHRSIDSLNDIEVNDDVIDKIPIEFKFWYDQFYYR
jgi:hypothetical protein